MTAFRELGKEERCLLKGLVLISINNPECQILRVFRLHTDTDQAGGHFQCSLPCQFCSSVPQKMEALTSTGATTRK